MAADGNVVPIGLVKNEWGGSMIEAWVPEANAVTGETYCTDRKTRVGRTPGKLFNSMIMPVSNVTIKGWLWYQVCPSQWLSRRVVARSPLGDAHV